MTISSYSSTLTNFECDNVVAFVNVHTLRQIMTRVRIYCFPTLGNVATMQYLNKKETYHKHASLSVMRLLVSIQYKQMRFHQFSYSHCEQSPQDLVNNNRISPIALSLGYDVPQIQTVQYHP